MDGVTQPSGRERAAHRARPGSIVKRGIDVAVAGALLAATLPVLAVSALGVWVEDRGPVFFRQERVGRGRRTFHVLKLRSMRENDVPVDALGQVRQGHALVTRAGAILRRLKIDELPQLWNVLVGDMSLVGPRPTVASQVERYDAFEIRRLEVRPGISGWAQVNGNTEITWRDRIALDVWYIDHWSLALDLRILARTLSVILEGERVDLVAVGEARAHAERLGRSG